jgi:hypothetical protein
MGLEKQPHFHKATWAQSTSVFPACGSPNLGAFVELSDRQLAVIPDPF